MLTRVALGRSWNVGSCSRSWELSRIHLRGTNLWAHQWPSAKFYSRSTNDKPPISEAKSTDADANPFSELTPTPAPQKKEGRKKANKTKPKTWKLPTLEELTGMGKPIPENPKENSSLDSHDKLSISKPKPKPVDFTLDLDDKARKILKRRPELEDRLKNIYEEDAKGKRVPRGWRQDRTLPEWQRQMYALREKFGAEKWNPRKQLSREAIEGIRALKEHSPELNAGDFAEMFKVPAESIRRILKSKWRPNDAEMDHIAERWTRRGQRVKSILREKIRQERAEKKKEARELREEQQIVLAHRGITRKKKTTRTRNSSDHKPKEKKADYGDGVEDIHDMLF